MIKVFISHSSKDVVLAKQLIDLLRSALNIRSSEIRCTSVPGYRLEGGAETDQKLRSELLATPVFIGLITEAGLSSAYVLFELGARWGSSKQLIPLMAPGLSTDLLQGPITNINALSCSSAADLHQLINQISVVLDVKAEFPAVYQDSLELVQNFPPTTAALSSQEERPSVPQSAVDQLAQLRADGIHAILNRPISSEKDVADLAMYVSQWWNDVKNLLEKHFSKAEELNFTRLGAVPNVVFPHNYNAQHAKILREFALQERRLLDIIARHGS